MMINSLLLEKATNQMKFSYILDYLLIVLNNNNNKMRLIILEC